MSEPTQTPHDATTENDSDTEEWPIWAEAYLAALREVPNLSRAAIAADIDRTTAHRLTKRNERFRLAVYDARETALDRLEEVIYAQATSGMPHRKTVTKTRKGPEGETIIEVSESEELLRNPTLAMFYLKRWRPEYRETFKVEQSGPGGGPVKHEVTLIEELAAEARADLERLSAS